MTGSGKESILAGAGGIVFGVLGVVAMVVISAPGGSYSEADTVDCGGPVRGLAEMARHLSGARHGPMVERAGRLLAVTPKRRSVAGATSLAAQLRNTFSSTIAQAVRSMSIRLELSAAALLPSGDPHAASYAARSATQNSITASHGGTPSPESGTTKFCT